MVSVPPLTPVTTPLPVTVAKAILLLLQIPPDTLSVSVILAPAQTFEVPVIIPAEGYGLMVIVFVEIAVPHELVTV